ncbi:MAG TPA: hypothetical protein VMP03_12660 [Methylomirabilota bacterium]|nr:hypothetical protein [Methylomirabilota bacterium]
MTEMSDPLVRIAITRDEALVLHEWLARIVDEENAEPIAGTLEDDAEAWALNALLSLLEQALSEPFEPGFERRLAAARKRIVETAGPWPFNEGSSGS